MTIGVWFQVGTPGRPTGRAPLHPACTAALQRSPPSVHTCALLAHPVEQDHVAEWDPPALAYAFHTAFVSPGQALRVSARELDVPGSGPGAAALAAAEGFFMHLLWDADLPQDRPP